jgi:peroxin-2
MVSGFSLASLLPSSVNQDPKGRAASPQKRGKYWSLPQDQCAICAENASFNLNISDPANAFTALATGNVQQSSSPEQTTSDSDVEPPPFPIYNPYIASCGDIYCYHCIAERMMRVADEGEDGPGWECLRCGVGIKSSERYTVEMGSDLSGSDYEFSSDLDMDSTGISESMGSYSESGRSGDNNV